MSDGTPQREIAPRLKKSVHRITSAGSVQALAIDQDVLFAGLQIGTVSAYSLDTYELLSSIFAHDESVLSLTLSDDHELLFSTGADSVVKVWSAQSLEPLYSLYPSHEIGDIFCVAHSSRKQTAFFGAQNGSVSWHRLKSDILTSPKPMFSPVSRKHRFFDSRGPGGSMSALQRRTANGDGVKSAGHKVILQNDEYKAYAHNGYIYSMLLAKGLFRHDGEEEVLITAGGGGNVKLWKIDSPTDTGLVQLFQFKNKGYSAFSLAYSGSFLYVGLSEGTAHVYNLASCQLVQRLNSGTADVTQIQLSQNMICCGTSDGWIKVCSLTSLPPATDLCSDSAVSSSRSTPGSRIMGRYWPCLRRSLKIEVFSSQVGTTIVSHVGTSRTRRCRQSLKPLGVMVRTPYDWSLVLN